MRELEFLPDWYPRIRKRRRWLLAQAWFTLVVAICLCSWLVVDGRAISAAKAQLATLNTQVDLSHGEVRVHEEQKAAVEELRVRKTIDRKLGLPVEMTRLITTLSQVMTPEMSLTDLSVLTEEKPHPITSVADAQNAEAKAGAPDRFLKVRMLAVAPTDVDVAKCLKGLTNLPFFDQVVMTFAKDRIEQNRVMREFEVTFTVDLNNTDFR